ncbi:cytochrome P450 [Nemania sp. FL0031]|nr:cytochrome P450 [Nemania sp. FL0031]
MLQPSRVIYAIMAYSSLILGTTTVLLLYLLYSKLRVPSAATSRFPPGPPTAPFLGNIHQIPLTKPFLKFAEWGRTYGSHGLLGLRLGPNAKAVVVNNWTAVRDLLDLRGAIYSSRPYMPIVDYIVPPGDVHMAFMPYGSQWRKARKTIMDFLKNSEVDKLLPLQHAESVQLIREILQSPEKWHDHSTRMFGAVIMASVFGIRGTDSSPEGKIMTFFDVQAEWAAVLAQGGAPPLEVFPFLKFVPDFLTPWRGWKQKLERVKRRQNKLYHDLLSEARTRVASGKGQDSFAAAVLRNNDKTGYTDEELDYLLGFMLEAGSDTTSSAFETFILALATNQGLQAQLQEEVDRVFGPKVMPNASASSDGLPLLRACFYELLRWRPSLPMALPHATTRDDVYEGMFIPANTTIIMNSWAVNHDPEEYDNPDAFDPSRFLKHPLGLKPSLNIVEKVPDDLVEDTDTSYGFRRQNYGFGAGRRVCAGQRMAENSMMMTMAKLVWSFDVVATAHIDNSIHAWTNAILMTPKHFHVRLALRSEDKRDVIESEWQRADAFLRRFE